MDPSEIIRFLVFSVSPIIYIFKIIFPVFSIIAAAFLGFTFGSIRTFREQK